ncbi:tetratricopeptide repeat protein [Candidatus Poribacteria bacterium]|nr:tetratricopeptide repeat protein [Candidatus Poribacteria bacterium]
MSRSTAIVSAALLILALSVSSCLYREPPKPAVRQEIEKERDESSVKTYGLSQRDIDEFYATHPEYAQRYLGRGMYPRKFYAGEFNKLKPNSKLPERVITGYNMGYKAFFDTSKVGHIRIRFDIAMECYRKGKLDEAEKLFKAIIPLKPDSPTIYYNLGLISFRKGDYRKAIENFRKCIEKARNGEMMIDAYVNSALCYMKLKKPKKAEEQLLNALQLNPDDPGIRYNLGRVYLEEGEPEKALDEFRRSLSSEEFQTDARIGMGLCYARMNQREKAVEQFKLVARSKDDGQIWYNIGVLEFDMGRYDQAKEAFNRATERGYPRTKMSRFLWAIERMKRRNARIAYNEGVKLQKEMRYREAVRSFRKAVELNPNLAEAYLNMAFCLQKTRKIEEAIKALEQALKVKPDFVEARYNLGTLYLRLGRYPEAIGELEKVVKARPYMAEARHNLGIALYHMNRYVEASTQFEETVKMRPKWAEAHYNLGLTWLRLNMKEKAISEFRETLRLDPAYRKAAEALESTIGANASR